jgi:subtilisin
MARQVRRAPLAGDPQTVSPVPPVNPSRSAAGLPELKPGVLITFRRDALKEIKSAASRFKNTLGVQSIAYASDFSAQAIDPGQTSDADMVIFDSLGVAVMDLDPDQVSSMSSISTDTAVAAIEREPIFFAFGDGLGPNFQSYLRGYKDAVDHLYEKMIGGLQEPLGAEGIPMIQGFQDTNDSTWGLTATRVLNSRSTGRDVRVCILDTGLDLDHPDFQGRQVVSQSFIQGQAVDDDNGHGTHCTGTACGSRSPTKGRRYGIAYEAEIFVGKVLSNQGSSLGRSTLAGMEWAVTNGCHIVSMSLGSRVQPGQPYLAAFEEPAREALRRNTLIIAAAGNDSRRSQGKVSPVGSPANCPSIMAVAAVDRFLRTADFSNGAVNQDGRIDIAGPGVDVYSSAPEPAATPQPPYFRRWAALNDTISGTSQATPHVAGIAALIRQENPNATADELWRMVTSKARSLPQPSNEVGAGLVQA